MNDLPSILSPLALWHPEGGAIHRLIVGSDGLPEVPSPGERTWRAELEVVVLAPSRAERRDQKFRARAMSTLDQLDRDGIGLVLAPYPWREHFCRELEAAGFFRGPSLWHVHLRRGRQLLVPVEAVPLAWVMHALLDLSPRIRGTAGVALRLPGFCAFLARTLPSVGTLVRRGGAPLLGWAQQGDVEVTSAVVHAKWRAPGGSATIYGFRAQTPCPASLAKVALSPSLALRTKREAEALHTLGADAIRAGARVPDGILRHNRFGAPQLLEPFLPGTNAARLLRAGRLAPLALIDWLSHWLASWNRITARFVPLDDERLQRELLDPAARLVHLLPEGAAYLAQLRRWGEAARTLPVASVATHNDLTMQNLLWHPPNPPAVLDWEAARPDGLPLVDFFYAAVDAYTQAGRPADRVRVFQSCFGSAGDATPSLTPLLERVREATATSPAAARVSFHACWIGHAVDEAEKHPEATSRPFLAIVRALSASSTGRSG